MTSIDDRVAQLELQVRRLLDLMGPARPDQDSYTYLCAQMNLTADQVAQIQVLLEKASTSRSWPSKSPMSWPDFQSRVSSICPTSEPDFATTILVAQHARGHWPNVYEQMKASGMKVAE